MQALTFVKARVEVRPQAVFLDSLRACVQGEVWMEQIRVWEQLEVKVPAPDKTYIMSHDMLGEDSTNTQTQQCRRRETDKYMYTHVKMLCRRRETEKYTHVKMLCRRIETDKYTHVKMLCRRRETDKYTRQNVVS